MSEPNLQEAIAKKFVEHIQKFLDDANAILGTHLDMPKELKFEVPNIDLHTVEHDAWRSWRKDDKGTCSFPAKENESGWIRLKNCNNDVANLYTAMKKQGIEKVSLGFFEYTVSGEFLQRKRLKKVEEKTEPAEGIEQPQAPIPLSDNLANIKLLFSKDLEDMLTFEEAKEYIVLRPRQYLGSDDFSKIAAIVRGIEGEYVSAGKQSHFRIPVKK